MTTPGLNCLEVITPGYRIILSAAGMSYEYHTNQDGSHLVLASGAEIFPLPALLSWSSITEPCTAVEFSLQEVRAAPCGTTPTRIGAFPLWRAAELEQFTALYAPLEGETAAGIVVFTRRRTGALPPRLKCACWLNGVAWSTMKPSAGGAALPGRWPSAGTAKAALPVSVMI